MQKHFFKFRKVFTNVACSPLILISNNSEIAAKYLPNDVEQSITILEINKFKKDFRYNFPIKDLDYECFPDRQKIEFSFQIK